MESTLSAATATTQLDNEALAETEYQRPAKRSKIAIACKGCRLRKTKCDGAKPVCGSCRRKRDKPSNCIYELDSSFSHSLSKSYISRLEARIHELERGQSATAGSVKDLTTDSYERENDTTSHTEVPIPKQNTPQAQLYDAYYVSPLDESSLPHNALVNRHQTHHRQNHVSGNTELTNSPKSHARQPVNSSGQIPSSLQIRLDETRRKIHSSDLSDTVDNDQSFVSRHSDVDLRDDDGMGKIDNGLPTHAIFGTSSVANFMRQVQATVDAKISSINGTPAPRHSITSHSLSSFDSTESRVYPEYVLPPRRTADRLLDTYWTKVHNLYPFIHRQSFIRSYQRLWTGDQPESDSPTFPCLLNIVFALASQLSEDSSPAKREALSNEYYKIAKRTLQPVLLDGSSFETIQILLLMAQYLQSTNSRDRCWIVVGLAIRLAQSLGLHFPETSANLPRQVDREMARRVWHGCVMMDRILSMTFGRPLTISRAIASAVPLPAPIDDEYLLESAEKFGEQRAGMPSQIEFFIQTVKLYGMLDDILLSLYSPNSDSATLYGKLQCWDNNSIFRVEAGLSRWKKEIPSCLQFNGQNEVSKLGSVFHRQSNVLQARYLHLRILLFRPVFTFFQDRDTTWAELFSDAFLQYSVAQQCVVQCIKAAQQLVELIHSNLQQDGSMGPLPAWWYNVFYIYTAATVMTATRLYPSVATDIDESLLTQSWNCALETLRAYQEYSRSAKRCLVTLEVLHEKVVGGIQAQNEEATEPTKSSRLDPWLDVNSTQQSRPNDAPEIQDLGDLGTTFDIMDMAWLDSTPFDLESYSWNTY